MPSPEVRGLNGHMDPLFTPINGSNPIGRCKELAGSCRCVTDDSFAKVIHGGADHFSFFALCGHLDPTL